MDKEFFARRDALARSLCRYICRVTGCSIPSGYRRAYDVIDWMDATLPAPDAPSAQGAEADGSQ